MAEQTPSASDTILDLVTGKTLGNLVDVRDTIVAELQRAEEAAEGLRSDSEERVIGALRAILAVGHQAVMQELPGLARFEGMARPQHKHVPLVRVALQSDVPVWLHGEAGSGKSTSGLVAAESLDLPFRSISLGPTSSKSDLFGYRDATGEYHGTGFRDIYEQGGVFLFDEIDNAHPSILTLLNSSLANGHGEFPDGRIERAPNARFIASANTIGKGAMAAYVGRAPIDAATIDRFAFVQMDIDESLEQALVLGEPITEEPIDISEGDVPDPREWLAVVRANRQAADEVGIRMIISPRAALYGTRMAANGVGKKWLKEMLIYKGIKEQDKEKLSHRAEQLERTVRRALSTPEDADTPEDREEKPRPTYSAIPNERALQMAGGDIEDSISAQLKRLTDGRVVNEYMLDFMTALSWKLEEYHGGDIYTAEGRRILYRLHDRPHSAIKTIDDLLEDPASELAGIRRYRNVLNMADIFRGAMRQYTDNQHDSTSQAEYSKLVAKFAVTYGFEGGPLSVAFWHHHTNGANA